MRLGLVTDIHNHAVELGQALALFRVRGVDQVVTIGDTCDAFCRREGADEVASLLGNCSAVGVWGNHDFCLCRDVSARQRERFTPLVLEVMARMQPRLVIDDCHFSHKEASVDPHDIEQLWEISDHPVEMIERAVRAFGAVEHRWQFVGHYHRWWAATPDGPLAWEGDQRLRFEPGQRYFVVIAAVCDGWCAILDTEQGELDPMRTTMAF